MLPSLEVYNDDVPRSAPMNMALDEVFWRSAGTARLRFYRWDHPAISFGYFGRYADVAPYADKWEIVRRCTGGGIVFHGNDLTYALVIPANLLRPSPSTSSVYALTHRAVQNALLKGGFDARLIEPASVEQSSLVAAQPNACFANPVRSDVMVDGQKVAGAAQRRSRHGLLQQGSIQNIQLPYDFQGRFVQQLAANIVERAIDPAVLDQAAELTAAKYATRDWLYRE